jgi:hypothetical protein
VNPLHWLADRLLLRVPNYAHLYVRVHRLGFSRGWACCLIAVLACYVAYVAGLALLAPAS